MKFNLSSLVYHDREWFVFQEVISRFPKDIVLSVEERLKSCPTRYTSRLGISTDWVIGHRKTKLLDRHFIEDGNQDSTLIFSGVLISSENFQQLLREFFTTKVTIKIEQFTLTEKLFLAAMFEWNYNPKEPDTISKVKIERSKSTPTKGKPSEEENGGSNAVITKKLRSTPKSRKRPRRIRHTSLTSSVGSEDDSDISKSVGSDRAFNSSVCESVILRPRKKAKEATYLISKMAKKDKNISNDENDFQRQDTRLKTKFTSPKNLPKINNMKNEEQNISENVSNSSPHSHCSSPVAGDDLSMGPCSPEVAPFPYGNELLDPLFDELLPDSHSKLNDDSQIDQGVNSVQPEQVSNPKEHVLNEQNSNLITAPDSTSDNPELAVSTDGSNISDPSQVNASDSPLNGCSASVIMANIKEQQKQLCLETDDIDLDIYDTAVNSNNESVGETNIDNDELSKTTLNTSTENDDVNKSTLCSNNDHQVSHSSNCSSSICECTTHNQNEPGPEKVDTKAAELLNGLIATGFVPQVRQLLENVMSGGGSETKVFQLDQDIKTHKTKIRQKRKSNQQMQINIKKKAKELEKLFENLRKGKAQCEEMEKECRDLESEKSQVGEQIKKCLDVLNSLN